MMLEYKGESKTSLLIREDFRAPKDKVYKAWTEPELLKKWFFPKKNRRTTTAELDLRVGGNYLIGISSLSGGDETLIKGSFEQIRDNEFLKYSWNTEIMEEGRYTDVEVNFIDQSPGCSISITHEVFKDKDEADLYALGWQGCIQHLMELLES